MYHYSKIKQKLLTFTYLYLPKSRSTYHFDNEIKINKIILLNKKSVYKKLSLYKVGYFEFRNLVTYFKYPQNTKSTFSGI